jgi:hypothetical protein
VISVLSVTPCSNSSEGLLPLLLRFPFKVLLIRHGVFFATGIILYSMKERYRSSQTFVPTRLAGYMLTLLLVGLAEVVLSVDRNPLFKFYGAVVWMGSVAFVIAGVVWGEWIEDHFSRRQSLFHCMGGMRYPIYLNQYALGMVVVNLWFITQVASLEVFLLSSFTVWLISYAVFALEVRIQDRLKMVVSKANARDERLGRSHA